MRFLCDAMLGKLARYLRILGLDAPYTGGSVDPEKLMPPDEPYYFFTKRRTPKPAANVIYVRSDHAREQVREVLNIIGPFLDHDKFMTRCITCNIPLVHVSRVDVEQHVPEFVFHHYEVFRSCPSCGKVYWEGSHTAHMSSFIEEVLCESREE